MTLRDTIRRELRIVYGYGTLAGDGHLPIREQVLEEGTTRIERAIEITRQSTAANVAARVAAEAVRGRDRDTSAV